MVDSARASATYPTSRGVGSATVSGRVDGMHVCAKRSRSYGNEATARELAVFAAADKENIPSAANTAVGETDVIYLAVAHMHRLCSRFSEFLLEDCSYKTKWYVHLFQDLTRI
jgi:hypothetical protein